MSKRLTLAAFTLVHGLGAVPVLGQEPTLDPSAMLPTDPAVSVGTLPNGLRYYVRENAEPRARAELRLVVKAGSVLEDDDQLGLAHFAEHMAFNGTEHFAKQELVDYLEGIGMRFGPDLNAFTSFDETVYMLKVPTDSAELLTTAFQILEDWAHNLTFDHEEIDKERGVVIEEWRRGRGASARMQDKQWPILLKDSRYAERLPIGKKEVLESFDYDVLKRFYRDWYRPDLMAVIAVGDFDGAAIVELIRQHFARLSSPESLRERQQYSVPFHDETLFAIATDPEATFNSVGVYWKQSPREESSIGDYRRSLVEVLYNQMFNQRLFELTQQADPPFLGAFSGQGRFLGSIEVYILGAGVPENGIERGLETVLLEAERVAQHGFTPTELDRTQRDLLRRLEQAYNEREKTESADYASEYLRSFLYDEPIPGIAFEYALSQKLVPAIELSEINRLARDWIIERNRVIMVNAPEKAGLEVPTEDELLGVFAAVDSRDVAAYEDAATDAPLVAQPPRPAEIVEAAAIEGLDVMRWELSNGVRVLLKPTDFKDDEILVRALSPGGTSLALDDDYIAASTADAVVGSGGAGQFSLVDLQKALAGKAVRVSPFIANLGEGLAGGASPQDVEALFQLIYLYFTAPRRDDAAFTSLKSRIRASLANRSADPFAAYQDTLNVTLSQHHFRTRPRTAELYEEMDLEKSLAFYRDRFADASDFTFVFVGNFDPDSLRPLILTYVGGLPSSRRVESWRDEGIRPPSGVVRKTVYGGIEPKSQTQIVFTGPFEWTRENRHHIRSLANVLRIRLREVLREDLGGTYNVGVSGAGSLEPVPDYTFTIGFGTAPDRLAELTDAVFAEIEKLKADGPTQQDIDKVKEMQQRQHETDLRENRFWLSQLISADRYGIDPRDILTYPDLVDSLTGEAIREAARRFLNTENYVRVDLYPAEWER